MPFNPALNLDDFCVKSSFNAPPSINALYLRDGQYDMKMTRADVAATFAAFRQQAQTSRLALFFHGGLVDRASGQQGAANQYKAYQDLVFPLFFIWESSLQEVLAHHLPLILAETIFGRVCDHTTTILESKFPSAPSTPGADRNALLERASLEITDADRAKIDVTSSDVDAFMTAIKTDDQIQREAVAIARTSQGLESLLGTTVTPTAPLQLSPRTYLSLSVTSAIRGAYVQANRSNLGSVQTLDALPFGGGGAIQAASVVSVAAVPALFRIVARFLAKRDHGFRCTLVEEVLRDLYLANAGSAIWEEMGHETELAFGTDSNRYGGTAVIEELCALVRDKPGTALTLVGHSAGAIYVGNFLRHVDAALVAQGDTTTTFDIILLAPANNVDFYASNYVNRIRGIRIFQMQDAAEQQDHLLSPNVGPGDTSALGFLYPRSLLYLVSGVCEYFAGQGGSGAHKFDGADMPILGMDRFYQQIGVFDPTDYPNVDAARRQFVVAPPSSPTRFVRVLSPTATTPSDGYRSTAEKHGNFPGDCPTIDSIRVCFRDGL